MEVCLIVTLGFHSDIGLRRIADRGVKTADRILVIFGPSIPASEKAVKEFKLYASKAGVKEENMQTLRIDPAEPWKGIPAIAQKIREVCGDRSIVVEAGGGLRGITVMLMLALFSMKRSFSVETSIEGTDSDLEIPEGFIQFLMSRLGTKDSQLLRAVLNSGNMSVKDIAKATGCGEKTVVNRISYLKKLGLVERKGRSPLKLTPWGEAAALLSEESRELLEKKS